MKAQKRPKKSKKYFTPEQANAMLPLLRSILRDVTSLAKELYDLQESYQGMKGSDDAATSANRDQLEEIERTFESGRDRMHAFLEELDKLGIELKDPFTGLIDFRTMMDGREVYLCWRMDEPEVAHWHDLEKGFSARQKLMQPAETN
ncbi:MAG TPA: DUF2203 domain-containing protein [Gemmataceae bacterium]|nr:DUF2203 domain-containing protein [Gemmataceae bacterium]